MSQTHRSILSVTDNIHIFLNEGLYRASGERRGKPRYNTAETGANNQVTEFVRTLDWLKRFCCTLLLVRDVLVDVLTIAGGDFLGDAVQRRFRLLILTATGQSAV